MGEKLYLGIIGMVTLLVGVIGFIFLNRKFNDGKERSRILTAYIKMFRTFAKIYLAAGIFCFLLLLVDWIMN